MKLVLCCVFVLCAIGWVDSLKILGFFPMGSYSHYSLGKRLVDGLVEKGHDVTLVGAYPEKDAKFKHVHLDGLIQKIKAMQQEVNMFEMPNVPQIFLLPLFSKMTLTITQQTFDHPEFKKFIASNEKFDVVIFETFGNDAYRGVCHHFNAPCVLLSAVETSYWTNVPNGNPENPAYIPSKAFSHIGPMNFFQRLQNTVISTISEIFLTLWAIPQQDKAMKTVFPNSPPLSELIYEPVLYLLNSHITTADPVALLPNMIEIGGYHVKPPKKLPEDLQKYLDDAKEGVVYFSMGSNLNSKDISMEKRSAILQALGKLKLKVLWKFEEDLPGKPPNVKISKWLPQQDILAHPNVKLFISHGGLLSTIEAITYGVPVIGIPIFGDQMTNMARAAHSGFGISLEYRSLTEAKLTETLNEILNNKKYSQNAKDLSKLMNDRPMQPLDTATYWIEYVARHKGVQHLRSAALDLNWYQIRLLDVLAVLGTAMLIGIYVFKIFLKKCCKFFCSKCNKKEKQVKKDKKNK